MSRQNTLYQLSQWIEIVSKQMNNLSNPQAKVLAMYSFAMALLSRSGQTSIAALLSELLNQDENTVRQRLREWCYDAQDKKGFEENGYRDQVEVEDCFVPLLKWILTLWKSSLLPLALDATALGDRFVILTVSIVYRGNAIPIAWKILLANQPHAWEPEWEHLLDLLKPAVPDTMFVLILTDRGLYSPSLFRFIQSLHWHPFMRINQGGNFRPEGSFFCPLAWFASRPGTYWCGQGTAFKNKEGQINCTLLAFWEQDAKEPWLILTDLPPDSAQACWYSLRSWIEQSFRTIKRGGFLWHNTKMTDPSRVSRLWLVIAIATFWLISIGTPIDDMCFETSEDIPVLAQSSIPIRHTLHQQQPLPPAPKRRLSVFRRGWIHNLFSLLSDKFLRLADLIPQPLPNICYIFNTT